MNTPVIFLILVCWGSALQDPYKNVYTESAWMDRDRWQKADELIRQMGIKQGDRVADVGCHEGYMTLKLSRTVGPDGKVYAVDVEQNKLDRLQENLNKRNIRNVTTVKGEYDDPLLPANSLDAVIILDTYHEMKQHDSILKHINESLRPGGYLILCEPIAEERRKLLRADQERRHELGMNFALEDLKTAGFSVVRRLDPFVDRVKEKGDKMWLIAAIKK